MVHKPLNRRVDALHHLNTLILFRIFMKADHSILLIYGCINLSIFDLDQKWSQNVQYLWYFILIGCETNTYHAKHMHLSFPWCINLSRSSDIPKRQS
jgi:hypothetical protein